MIVDKWDQVLSDHKTGSLEIVGCSSHEDCLSRLEQRGNHHEELRDQMFDHLYRLEHRENHHGSDLSIFTWIISGLILDTTPSEKPVD